MGCHFSQPSQDIGNLQWVINSSFAEHESTLPLLLARVTQNGISVSSSHAKDAMFTTMSKLVSRHYDCPMELGSRNSKTLTRAWPGSQPNAIDRGGTYNAPPQANSQTNDRSETGEAALERSRRDGSKALLKIFLKGHVSGQGQVKGQNWAFQHFGSQNRQLDLNRPKLGQNTLKG